MSRLIQLLNQIFIDEPKEGLIQFRPDDVKWGDWRMTSVKQCRWKFDENGKTVPACPKQRSFELL